MKKFGNIFRAVLFVSVFAVVICAAFLKNTQNDIPVTYNEFLTMIGEHSVTEVTFSDSPKIKFIAEANGEKVNYITDNPRIENFKEMLLLNNINVVEGSDTAVGGVVQSLISLVFFILAFYMLQRYMGKNGLKSAMALNAEDKGESSSKFSFSDVAGNDEAKESVADIVDFIKNPEKYSVYGARMPRGVIFYGPPGTGKTLMAKAIAGEAGVGFFAVSGSDFVQMYVGVGASRIRELFKKAREYKKAVIFIDEIDAIGKERSKSTVGGNDERDQTLNALLTEMSGFSSTDGIVVIAATNRLDTLDDALLRPGRFDRQVEIGLPDLNARKRIITYHAKDKPVSSEIDFDRLAKQTVYFSGAMLENLLNEAAIFAAKRGNGTICNDDIDKAYYTVIAGSEKKDRSQIKETERRITAFHEAGHALVTKLLMPENSVAKVTIIPSVKGAGGFSVNIPPDKMYYTKHELESQIMINYAGRAAEEIIFGEDEITTGASNDIEKASKIIRDFVVKYGMGSMILNAGVFEGMPINAVMEECEKLTKNFYTKTKELINSNMNILSDIAEKLLLQETLNEEEIDALVHA